jgi:PhnB protein
MSQDSTPQQGQIRAMIEDWAEGLRRKDAPRVVAHGTADYLHFSLAPPLISRTDRQGLEAWFATWRGPLSYDMRDLSVTASGDVAFCTGLVRLAGTKTDGGHNEIWFRLTLGLRKIGGTWKIVHEHESVPFYMDGSMKAAVDLKP